MRMIWVKLDNLMGQFATKLRDDLGINAPYSQCLATTMANEIRKTPKPKIMDFLNSEMVDLRLRIDELKAFERFMDYSAFIQKNAGIEPGLARAQVIVQLYISFVYLNEACFSKFRKICPAGSVVKKCCKSINDNPIRGIRNSVAHANWKYNPDFSGLIFNYFKDEQKTILDSFELNQLDLSFWSSLSRTTAYVIYETTNEILSQENSARTK